MKCRKNGSAENIFRETGKSAKGLRGMVAQIACAHGGFISFLLNGGEGDQEYTGKVIDIWDPDLEVPTLIYL
jgi:hypothetical protein